MNLKCLLGFHIQTKHTFTDTEVTFNWLAREYHGKIFYRFECGDCGKEFRLFRYDWWSQDPHDLERLEPLNVKPANKQARRINL